MRWPFVSRARHKDLYERYQLALQKAAKACSERDTAEYNRGQALRQLADADATNRRLEGRITELTKRIEERPSFEDSAALRNQIRHLQRRLDDAVGLPPGRIEDSRRWQPGYEKPGGAS
jgi:protein-arginine kinase activator protein McsA